MAAGRSARSRRTRRPGTAAQLGERRRGSAARFFRPAPAIEARVLRIARETALRTAWLDSTRQTGKNTRSHLRGLPIGGQKSVEWKWTAVCRRLFHEPPPVHSPAGNKESAGRAKHTPAESNARRTVRPSSRRLRAGYLLTGVPRMSRASFQLAVSKDSRWNADTHRLSLLRSLETIDLQWTRPTAAHPAPTFHKRPAANSPHCGKSSGRRDAHKFRAFQIEFAARVHKSRINQIAVGSKPDGRHKTPASSFQQPQ